METVLWGIALLKHSNHEFSGLYLLEPALFLLLHHPTPLPQHIRRRHRGRLVAPRIADVRSHGGHVLLVQDMHKGRHAEGSGVASCAGGVTTR